MGDDNESQSFDIDSSVTNDTQLLEDAQRENDQDSETENEDENSIPQQKSVLKSVGTKVGKVVNMLKQKQINTMDKFVTKKRLPSSTPPKDKKHKQTKTETIPQDSPTSSCSDNSESLLSPPSKIQSNLQHDPM